MPSSMSNLHGRKWEQVKGLLLPLLLLGGAIALQIRFAFSIGFMGYYFTPPVSAGAQESLSAIISSFSEESLMMSVVHHLMNKGFFGPTALQIGTLFFHYMNCILAFFVAFNVRKARLSIAIAVAALVGMNPLGVESLAWGLSLQMIVCLTLIFSGILIACSSYIEDLSPYNFLKAGLLAIMQILAFFVWNWGFLFFPIVTLICLVSPPVKGKQLFQKKKLLPLFICGVVWLCGSLVLFFVIQDSFPSNFSLITTLKSIALAPIEGVFPLLNKEIYYSVVGVVLSLFVYAYLIVSVWVDKTNLALIGCFVLAVLPWAVFRYPVGRDFYICMPFLYLTLTSFKNTTDFVKFLLFVYLAFVFLWMFERIHLIEKGRHQSSGSGDKSEKMVHQLFESQFESEETAEMYRKSRQERFLVPYKR